VQLADQRSAWDMQPTAATCSAAGGRKAKGAQETLIGVADKRLAAAAKHKEKTLRSRLLSHFEHRLASRASTAPNWSRIGTASASSPVLRARRKRSDTAASATVPAALWLLARGSSSPARSRASQPQDLVPGRAAAAVHRAVRAHLHALRRGIIQVPPGGVLSARRGAAGFDCRLTTFAEPVRTAPSNSDAASEEAFEAAMQASVSERLLSDVELGVYLSGGIDSKAIAFELSRAKGAGRGIKSFTIGFEHQGYDETDEAVDYARFLGFDPQVDPHRRPGAGLLLPLAVLHQRAGAALHQRRRQVVAQPVRPRARARRAHRRRRGRGAVRLPELPLRQLVEAPDGGNAGAGCRGDVQALLEAMPLGRFAVDGLYARRFAAHGKDPWLSGSSAEGSGDDFIRSLDVLGVQHPLFGQISTIAAACSGATAADAWLRAQADSVQSWFAAGIDDGRRGSRIRSGPWCYGRTTSPAATCRC
jgi:hypothetical protein